MSAQPLAGTGVGLEALADELLAATEPAENAQDALQVAENAEDALQGPEVAALPAADQAEDAQDALLLVGSSVMQWSRAGLTGAPAPSGSTAELLPDGAWQNSAACRSASLAEADIFTGARSQTEAEQLVQGYCKRCPVRLACLQDGRQLRGWGIFGGVVLVDGRKAARERPESRQDTSSRPPSRYPSEARRDSVPFERIRSFLTAELAGGPVLRRDLLVTADSLGIAPASAMKAARRMQLVSTRLPGTNAVLYSLPAPAPLDGPAPAPLEEVALWLIEELASCGPIFPGAVVSDAIYPAERIYEAAALLDLPHDEWRA